MRHHDITDPIDVINFKIGWFQRLASHIVTKRTASDLLAIIEDIHTRRLMPSELAVSFLPVLEKEHRVYSGVIGHFICKTTLEKLDLYDETFRLAPEKQEMGRIEDVTLVYHTDTREYEVSDGSIGVRFPALYVPMFGIDISDEETAAEIAMAILNSKTKRIPAFDIRERFPLLDLAPPPSLDNKPQESAQI